MERAGDAAREELELGLCGEVGAQDAFADASFEQVAERSAEALVRVVLVGLDALADEDDVAVGDREQDAGEPLDPLRDGRVLEPGVGDPLGDLVERLGGERSEQRVASRVMAIAASRGRRPAAAAISLMLASCSARRCAAVSRIAAPVLRLRGAFTRKAWRSCET